MKQHPSLSAQLKSADIIVAPGIYDGFGAALAEKAGFHTAYLSGASIAYTRFGTPDIGLISMSEVADTLSIISERTDMSLIVDADTGFGNAINVMRTVKVFERAGANAIQLEDQTLPKRCGHLAGKNLVSTGEMAGKIRAALDARQSEDTLIIARTDGIGVEGFEAALERAEQYVEAGADMLFVEAPQSREQMEIIAKEFGTRVPLMANMVEGGKTPLQNATELEDLGYKLVIFPGGMVRAIARTMQAYLDSLKAHGSTLEFRENMLDFNGLNDLLGTADLLAQGARYDPAKFEVEDD